MMFEIVGITIGGVELFLGVILLAFFLELVDASLGMGYGTALTPVLILAGFDQALAIVPSVLLSQLIAGFAASVGHHKLGNVNFKKGSIHLKIAIVLGVCSIVGSLAAVLIAVKLSNIVLTTYIGVMALCMGVVILITINKEYRFSWNKIAFLGIVAAFNKGLSGGGYGPLVTGGQMLSGVKGNNAVGITTLSEGLVSLVSVSFYLIAPALIIGAGLINWSLAPSLIIGSLLSVPFSTNIVRRLDTQNLKLAISILTIALGVITLIKIYFP